jgi:hypothetical protein
MEVKIEICQPKNINEIVIPKMTICEIPISHNIISIGEEMYCVIQTLYKQTSGNWLNYEFEQLVRPYKKLDPNNVLKPHLLLRGTVYFFDEVEMNLILKQAKFRWRDFEQVIKLPYNYMRRYDCILSGDDVLLCENVIVKDDIEVDVDFYGNPIRIDNFRTNFTGFGRHID